MTLATAGFSPDLLQTLGVSLIALAAAAWIVWRVASEWRPSNAAAGCGSCPSHKHGCATNATSAGARSAGAPAPRAVQGGTQGVAAPLHVLRR